MSVFQSRSLSVVLHIAALVAIVVLFTNATVLPLGNDTEQRQEPVPTALDRVIQPRFETLDEAVPGTVNPSPSAALHDPGRVPAVSVPPSETGDAPSETGVSSNPSPAPSVDAVSSPEGWTVANGVSDVVGTGGPLRTFTVEVVPETGLRIDDVVAEVESILLDTERGWTAQGERSLQRIADPGQADIRVVVAPPQIVDQYCARMGLNTVGRLSCWDGQRSMLNLDRWNTGVEPFYTDLSVYRPYLVSHEFGHGLGYSHVNCQGVGEPAPVMQQQSKGLDGCTMNGWPYPG